MFRILVMDGLLISLIFIWTSAANVLTERTLMKSSVELPTGPLNNSPNEAIMEIRGRETLCSTDFDGTCISKKESCPSHLPSEKSPGKPYCSKKDRCCYPGLIIELEDLMFQKSEEDHDVTWSDIRNACIKGNNYKTYTTSTIDICKEKCVEEDAISCQSIEYSSSEQMCSISEARSEKKEYVEPCFVNGWEFAEIEIKEDNCIDKSGHEDCEYWENNFKYCSEGEYIDFMEANCKKTCLKCEVSDECFDKSGQESCEYWEKEFKYCSEGEYIDYMTENCKKTCLKCGHSFCNYLNSKLDENLQNTMHRESDNDCGIVWDSNNDGSAPFILTCIDGNPEIIRVEKIKHGTSLRFTCPGDDNSFYHDPGNYIDVTCSAGKLMPFPIEKLGCETRVGASIQEPRTGRGVDFVVLCGKIDDENLKGIWHPHNVYMSLKTDSEADSDSDTDSDSDGILSITLLDFCFNEKTETTVMTKHTLSGGHHRPDDDLTEYHLLKKRRTEKRLFTPSSSAKVDFRTDTDFFAPSMFRIYEQKHQKILFENLELAKAVTDSMDNTCNFLQKGHMAPKGDFVTKGEKDATFYYINVMPQWGSINNGNWKGIESSIRGYIANKHFDLTIYTGRLGVLKFQSKKPDLVEVFLSNSYPKTIPRKRGLIPVPQSTWKVVYAEERNEAVAFMVYNNPFITSENDVTGIPNGIKSQCENISNWLKGVNNGDLSRGLTWCFTVEDFKTAFGDFDPNIDILISGTNTGLLGKNQ